MTMGSFDSLHLTGVKINYFFVCERKLWFFDRGIRMEKESDRVFLGKLLDEESFPRKKRRRITIDELITIDMVDDRTIQEIKYSRAFEKASIMQVGYYLYYLRNLGIEKEGVILYPRQKKRERVVLTEAMVQELEEAIRKIQGILSRTTPPPPVSKPYCRKCAYFELCFG
jgi:CRISPR-associated exonuclease Cas4